MKTEFRNRAFLPVVLPLAILLVIAAGVGVVASILLFVDRQGAVAIALLGAAGVLVAISLAASQDKLDGPRKGVVGLAGITPLLVGALVAIGAVGGIADEDRNINVEPHAPQFVLPGLVGDAPVLAAESSTTFCIPGDGGCEETNEWEFSYTPEQIQYAFDNREAGVPHNLTIFDVPAEELEGLEEPIALSALQEEHSVITPGPPDTITGPDAQQTYQWVPPGEDAGEEAIPIPETAYFLCTVHPSTMWGVVSLNVEE